MTSALGGTGAMIVGDVGQGAREEIDYEPAGRGGRNYGWRNREGTLDNVTSRPPAYLPLTDPIFDYPRSSGSRRHAAASSTAARRWRPRSRPLLLCRLRLGPRVVAVAVARARERVRRPRPASSSTRRSSAAALGNITSFGADASGELYLCSSNGTIFRISPERPSPRTR